MLPTSSRLLALLVLASAMMILTPTIPTNEVSANQPEQSAAKESESNPRSEPRGRVPNGFGKLGLTDKQREEIYSIQGRYKSEVERLQQQLDELKQQEFVEVQSVLTDVQREAYRAYLKAAAEARKQRASR